ncbi:MAG: LrgB family protein [Rubrivivax sp.]
MADFVELWVYLASTPLFGLTATIATYVLAQAVYERTGQAPWANPVLWSVVAIGTALVMTRTPYPSYFSGAQFIHVLLGPAVVALAWPLWQRRAELRARGLRLLLAGLTGGAAAAATAIGLGLALDLPGDVLRSLVPKSVTAPVAMGLADRLGGVPAMAAVFAVLTGMVGALSAKALFGLLRIDDWTVRGFALGTTSHGIGAARAMQVHPDAGAYAGLAMALQVLTASLWMPWLARWWGD